MDEEKRESFNQRRKAGLPFSWEEFADMYNVKTIDENMYIPDEESYFRGLQEAYILSKAGETITGSMRDGNTKTGCSNRKQRNETETLPLYIMDSLDGEGNGVHTSVPIKEGQLIGYYVGLVQRISKNEKLGPFSLMLSRQLGLVVDAENEGNITRLIHDDGENYNCVAKCVIGEELDLKLQIIASRNIMVDEELLLSHNPDGELFVGQSSNDSENEGGLGDACSSDYEIANTASNVSIFNDYCSDETDEDDRAKLEVKFEIVDNPPVYSNNPTGIPEDCFDPPLDAAYFRRL